MRRSTHRPRKGHWATLAAVSIGGVLGGTARYAVEQADPVSGAGFPWGTFGVNMAGAFVLSMLLVLIIEVWPPYRYLRAFLAIGFLGSFTTFSTWMLQVHDLVGTGRIGLAAAYLAASLSAGLAAALLGLLLARAGVRALTRHQADTR